MNVLIYSRPWNNKENKFIVKKIFPNAKTLIISDFKSVGDVWIGQWHYKSCSQSIFTDTEIEAIIKRCRFLRSLHYNIAKKLVNNVSYYVYQLVCDENFDFLYSQVVDCYTMDIIFRIFKKRNIPIISLINSFIQGYSRLTLYGETVKCRDNISKEEVENIIHMLNNIEYKPNFKLNKNKKKIELILYFYRRKIIQNIIFPLIKLLQNDKYNYHYNTIEFHKKNIKNYIPEYLNQCFCNIEQYVFHNTDIYVPLHYTPEATVDYWCDNINHIDYEKFILNFIKNSSPNLRFFVKEHPAKYGKRDVSFYDELIKLKNVYLVHPYDNSNSLLEKIPNVLVTTGSVGIEAIIRGKHVFCTSKNYYSDIAGLTIVKFLNQEIIENDKIINTPNEFMFSILKNHFPFPKENVDFKLLKEYIKLYANKKK